MSAAHADPNVACLPATSSDFPRGGWFPAVEVPDRARTAEAAGRSRRHSLTAALTALAAALAAATWTGRDTRRAATTSRRRRHTTTATATTTTFPPAPPRPTNGSSGPSPPSSTSAASTSSAKSPRASHRSSSSSWSTRRRRRRRVRPARQPHQDQRVGPLLYFNAPTKFWTTHATAAQAKTYGGKWIEFSAVDPRFTSFDQFLSAADLVVAPSRVTRPAHPQQAHHLRRPQGRDRQAPSRPTARRARASCTLPPRAHRWCTRSSTTHRAT